MSKQEAAEDKRGGFTRMMERQSWEKARTARARAEMLQSRYALLQLSKRRFALIQRDSGFRMAGSDFVGMAEYEFIPGFASVDYMTANEELLRLRREEREENGFNLEDET